MPANSATGFQHFPIKALGLIENRQNLLYRYTSEVLRVSFVWLRAVSDTETERANLIYF